MSSMANVTVAGTKKKTSRKFIITGIFILLALLVAGLGYYQTTHFNSQITINNKNVGGLTANQAIKRLNTSVLKNKVYVGKQQILDEIDTHMGFTDTDLPEVEKILKSQQTIFPSSNAKNFIMIPKNADQYRSQTMKRLVEKKLITMNKNLKAPRNAEAKLEEGKIIVSNGMNGKQYDVASLMEDCKKQEYSSDIYLKPVYIQPIKENSPVIKEEKKLLQGLLQQSLDYKVQDRATTLKASDLIKNASVSKDMKITIDPSGIKEKIAEIDHSQSTLDKNFTFKTHSGSVISVKGQGYGWALNVEKETELVKKAFENGEKSISASNIYGHGWTNEGYGYKTTTNNGIGDTYAEVSIKEQRIWIYKSGKLAVTTNVVTGRHNTHEDTSPGVWYILYKRSPSTLTGSEAGNPHYSVKVNYWAPFTNGGQGFHDASWRKNWASNAYLTAGSGGCVNTPVNIMKSVYDNLSTYEPVVVY
ncbi:L,D-transpeptidase family protein [Neobacillus terrae]|uniref:L,D-transpeptidase family protein n=1 Tax=Neobacillus terrae TaxID=3034837 RepID=UPI0014086478|nr:L,D-transpeptidase family protein [Neobacillus terrae]NHM32598.1 L,D-transpeptidase family protein [Neobacillus terrae]